MRLHVVPAYGRDYKSWKAVKEAWDGGKDFQIQDISSKYDGSYINKEDAVRFGVTELNIRYSKLTKVAVLKVVP